MGLTDDRPAGDSSRQRPAGRLLHHPLFPFAVGILLVGGFTLGLYLWPDLRPPTEWEKDFRAAAAGTTRIRVRTHGTGDLEGKTPQTLFEETDPGRAQDLVESIRAASRGTACMCNGWPSIEFYAGDRLLLTLSVHHGKNLRWPGHEGGDARMSPRTARRLNAWLAKGSERYWAQKDTATGTARETGEGT